jgi:hypothetical protein
MQVEKGLEVVKEMQDVERDPKDEEKGRPSLTQRVLIADCGELKTGRGDARIPEGHEMNPPRRSVNPRLEKVNKPVFSPDVKVDHHQRLKYWCPGPPK